MFHIFTSGFQGLDFWVVMARTDRRSLLPVEDAFKFFQFLYCCWSSSDMAFSSNSLCATSRFTLSYSNSFVNSDSKLRVSCLRFIKRESLTNFGMQLPEWTAKLIRQYLELETFLGSWLIFKEHLRSFLDIRFHLRSEFASASTLRNPVFALTFCLCASICNSSHTNLLFNMR